MHPSWDELNRLRNPLTPGERALLQYLDAELPDTWHIYAQPYLNGSRPDVVIFNPALGAMIYEVKDWALSAYKWTGEVPGRNFYVNTRSTWQRIISPLQQVDYYREKIIGRLMPGIGEYVDSRPRAYGIIKVGVYFHQETTAAAQEFLVAKPKAHTPIIGRDALTRDQLEMVVPDVYRTSNYHWKRAWNEELLFWLAPPLHAVDQTIQLTLSETQRLHAEPVPGHHRLRGIAGSGKTQVLAYRAAKLASEGYSVLVLTFNITLWHFIRDLVSRSPFAFSWRHVTFNHYHGFCRDLLVEAGAPWPEGEGEEFWRREVPGVVLAAIAGKDHDRWDAILIDEGQDYYWDWYDMLAHLTTERDELLLLWDSRQNIYGRELGWADEGMRNVKFRGRWGELKTVFRLPPLFVEYAQDFANRFGLEQDVQLDGAIQQYLFERPIAPHASWNDADRGQWLDKMDQALELLRSIQHPSDAVILVPDIATGLEGVKHFEEQGIAVNHVFEDADEKRFHPHKKAFWMGDSRLKMCTIHSFKGWEARTVVLFIPDDWAAGTEMLDQLVYTALTRTRENLLVFNGNPRYREFGAQLPDSW